MATLEFKLPDIGEGVHEGEIVKWIVAEGASVQEDDPVVEVMTDKATVEIPAPQSGTITKHNVPEGEIAKVGDVLFVLEGGADGGAAASAPAAAAPESAPAPAPTPAPAPAAPAASTASNGGGTAVAVAPPPVQTLPADPGKKVLAAPATRRLARELGVDLSTVPGTGPRGRIKPEDVRAIAATPAAPAAPSVPVQLPGEGAAPAPVQPLPAFAAIAGSREVEREPFRGVRKLTADAMTRSKTTAAHFSLIEEVDVTDLKAIRKEAKGIGAQYGVNVTYLPYIMKATAIALSEYPQLNAMLDEDAQEIVTHKYVNLGIAVDGPRGLMVPVVNDVQAKGVLQMAAEVADLAARVRDSKIKPDELKGATFSITNAGNIGGVFATPIINFPNVAIMGVHAIRRLPRVLPDDSIVPRDILWLSISIDHRLVDGADGARFMVRVRELLENPALMLL